MPRTVITKKDAPELEAVMVRLTPMEKTLLDGLQEAAGIITMNSRGERVRKVPSYSELVGLLIKHHHDETINQ